MHGAKYSRLQWGSMMTMMMIIEGSCPSLEMKHLIVIALSLDCSKSRWSEANTSREGFPCSLPPFLILRALPGQKSGERPGAGEQRQVLDST